MTRRIFLWTAAALLALDAPHPALADTPGPDQAAGVVSERIYDAARPRLLQVRSVLASADKQSEIGSAFLVSADGLAITNYHVVSQFALEPETYRLEYTAADGRKGALKLLAVDVADDLAVVRVDQPSAEFFQFDAAAVSGVLPKGQRLYAMGNPLDLGFTIVDGTNNGLVERSYQQRIHFSGAINPGMSGGPAVTEDGRVVGINVAKQLGQDLVSFLVPAQFASALLARAAGTPEPTPGSFKAEIGRQLYAWQDGMYHAIAEAGFRDVDSGPYRAPEASAPWFTCWARTNENEVPKPRAADNTTGCNTSTALFVANDLTTGLVLMSHAHLKSIDLNPFQFATFASQTHPAVGIGTFHRKWQAAQACHEDFVQAAPAAEHPAVRVVWCARPYKTFDGLYDVLVQAMTQDRDDEALVSRMNLQAISYDNAMDLTRRFLAGIRWKP
jgi:S1-C subfamily serine protease